MNKYCDIDPKFPKIAWFGFIFKKYKDQVLMVPIKKLHLTKKEGLDYLKLVAKKVKYKDDEWDSMVIKIKLVKKIRNKREYWTREKELIKIDPFVEMMSYVDVVKHSDLYRILVVGVYRDKKNNWEWGATMRFLKSDNNKTVETYMYKSKEPVSERAKYSALYEVMKIIGVKKSGEENKVEPESFGKNETLN